MSGRVYDDGPDRGDTVFAVDHETWVSESRHELEPNVVEVGRARGDAATAASEWDSVVVPLGVQRDEHYDQEIAPWAGGAS